MYYLGFTKKKHIQVDNIYWKECLQYLKGIIYSVNTVLFNAEVFYKNPLDFHACTTKVRTFFLFFSFLESCE